MSIFRSGAPIFALALLFFSGTAWSMDKAELVKTLQVSAPAEADLISRYPADIQEEPLAFLAPYVSLRVALQHPNHPIFLTVAYKAGERAYVISRGAKEYELFRDAARPKVDSEASALEAAKWYLHATGGKAFWLIEKLEDIPFLPDAPDDEQRCNDLKHAREHLQGRITAPSIAAVKDDYQVRLCGIQGRTLFQYTVTVTRTARITFQTECIMEDVPVVWVR